MNTIGLPKLHEFIKLYPKSKSWLENWISDARNASWKNTHDVKARYSTCSFLADNKAIFNVCGNNYRLIVIVAYNSKTVIVEWIGTHAEYTQRIRQRGKS